MNITLFKLFGKCLTVYALLFWSVVASQVYAASVEELLDLDLEELASYQVVAPTKTDTPLSEVPGAVTLITYDQIQRSAARTIPELLRLVPGVHVRWNPMVQTIDIRSFGANPFTSKVLLLIDGIPYNSWNKGGFPQHPGFDFFNINNVKHLEVIRGAGSALYGENAFNGVINIVTLSGDEFRQTTASVYMGERNTKGLSVTHGSKLGEDGSIFVSGQVMESRLPQELWSNSEAQAYNLFIKARYKGFQASYYRMEDKFDGFSVTEGANTFSTSKEIEQQVNILTTQYDYESDDKNWSFQTKASYSNRDGSHCASCHAPKQLPDKFMQPSDHGYQAYANAHLRFKGLEDHDILFGTEIRRQSAGDHDHEFAQNVHEEEHDDGHGADDHETLPHEVVAYNKHALILQDSMHFIDRKLNVVAGVRYDSATSEKLFDKELFPRLAVVAKPSEDITLRAGWNKAARYPSFTELYQSSWFISADIGDITIPFASFEPNYDLKPEYLESYEFGVGYEYSSKVHYQLDLYQQKVDDSITVVYSPSAVRFENHGNQATVSGAEFELRYRPSAAVNAFVNWSYQDNRQSGNSVDSAGNPIEFSYSPRNKVNFGLQWNPVQDLTANVEVSWRDKYKAPKFWYALINGSPKASYFDDYALLNLTLQYRMPFITSGGRRPLTLSLYGKNLSNEQVQETFTSLGGENPGREFYLKLEYDWTL